MHSFPVGLVFPPMYRDSKVTELTKWVDNKKPVFTVRTKLLSTIYSQDSHLNAFWNITYPFVFPHLHQQQQQAKEEAQSEESTSAPSTPRTVNSVSSSSNVISEGSVCGALQGLSLISPDAAVQYFPVIVRQLFRLICCYKANSLSTGSIGSGSNNSGKSGGSSSSASSINVSEEAFLALLTLLDNVHQATHKHNFLEIYLHFVFQNETNQPAGVPASSVLLYEELCRIWVNIIMQRVSCAILPSSVSGSRG